MLCSVSYVERSDCECIAKKRPHVHDKKEKTESRELMRVCCCRVGKVHRVLRISVDY